MSTKQQILDSIEAARRAGEVSNDAARAASIALGLEGDDAMLANRVLAQGADPASIQYLATGKVAPFIDHAHRNGPGSLEGRERDAWLFLAAISADESKASTLRDRISGLAAAVELLDSDYETRMRLADQKRIEIESLPFRSATVGGREMRLYESDLGFAAAYWTSTSPCAAVLGSHDGKPYIAVGSNGTPLADLGVTVDKPLAPCFGIIEDPDALATILD